MSAFTLDTSGAVFLPIEAYVTPTGRATFWPDLSPFEQGYVEALFASIPRAWGTERPYMRNGRDWCGHFVGFSDLAPETLAAIRKDCEAYRFSTYSVTDTDHFGGQFWSERQSGLHRPTFLPLTVTLGDDGKVRLSAVHGTAEQSARPRETEKTTPKRSSTETEGL